jgi:small subunit ribosomal protein S8e
VGVYQWRDHKKPTGGKRNWYYKVKRKHSQGRYFVPAVVAGEGERVTIRVRGGGVKVRLRKTSTAVISDPKTGKTIKARILRVLETPANREYARRQIIVKGAVIETTEGKAIVTSRPGQDGVVNAVLLREEK